MEERTRRDDGPGFRFLLAVDTEGYTDHIVDERELLVRKLHEIALVAARDAGIDVDPRDPRQWLDRGDGFAVIFPADFDRYVNLIHPFLANLDGGLDEYNRNEAAPRMRMRLRVAMHYGLIRSVEESHVGAIDEIFRLLDCEPLRRTLRTAEDAHLAVIISSFVYDNAVKPRRRRIDPAAFHEVDLRLRGEGIGRFTAWLHLPGVPDPGPRFWAPIVRGGAPSRPPALAHAAAAVAAGLAAVAAAVWPAVRRALRRLGRWSVRHAPPRRWTLTGVAAVVVAAASAAAYFVVIAPTVGSCPAPLALNVLTSPASLRPVRDAAMTYQGTQRDHGCVRVDMTVYAVPDGAAHEALNNGWHTTTELTLGPPPNVWMPDTSADRALLDAHRVAGTGLRLRALGSTRASPYVVDLPSGVAASLDVPRVGASWRTLDQAVRTAGLRYARPSTVTSTTALAQTQGIWQDLAPGRDGGPDERTLEHDLDDRTLTGPDESDLLCTLRNDDNPPKAAVLVTERALAVYNAGRPLNDRCGWADGPAGDAHRLTPYYPGAVRTADYPLYELTYGSDMPAQHREVLAFFRWLRGEGQTALAADGYRDVRNQVRGVLAGGDAGPIEAGLGPVRPTPELGAFAARLAALRQNVRVLVAVDLSGTMNEPTTRGTRFDASRDAMREAGNLISQGDTIELWGFPAYGRAYGHVPIVATGEPRAYLDEIDGLEPKALRTPLYQTIQDGVRYLAASGGPRTRGGLLVISDGLDDPTGPGRVSAAALEKTLDENGRGVSVLLVNPVRGGCGKVTVEGVQCAELDGPGDPVYTFFTGLWGG